MMDYSGATNMKIILILVLLINIDPMASAPECTFSKTTKGLKAKCSRLGLSTVPNDLPKETAVLDLSGNTIIALYNSSFKGLPNLVVLELTNNNITTIEGGALLCLLNLKQLLLSHNKLGKLQDNLFRNNNELDTLVLTNNQFFNNAMSAISPLKKLVILNMEWNSIKCPNFTGFESGNLSLLNLNKNNIADINSQIFYPLENKSIGILSLNFNEVKILPPYAFCYLKNVRNFQLRANNIEKFSLMPFLEMKSLINLTINDNNISHIISVTNATEIRLSIPKLKMLFLARNRLIRVIPSKAFDGLEELEYLYIYECQITHLHNNSFTGLNSLKLLNLASNKIREIHGRIFTSFSNLQTLQLSNNKLSLQSAVQITGLRTLQTLFLDGNDIQLSTPLVWDLPNLSSLHLSNNGILLLSGNSFLGLENLTHLTLSKNQISAIRNHAFGGLNHLQKLDLSAGGNIGSFASPFQNLQQLIEIDMSGTSFHPIQQIFLGLNSLRGLSLSRCSLTRDSLWDSVKNASIFATVTQLEFLYLSWNSLNVMHSGSFHPMSSLTTLKLDHCAISVLHPDIFRNLSSLEYLYIEYNYIKVISLQHLLELHSLMALYAQNNDIKQINKEAFSEKKHFLTLNIANNGISWIEEGTVLPRRYLDISNNPLACVCKLMWFRMELDKRNLTLGKSNDTTCSQTSIPSLVGQPLLSFNPKHSCAPNIALYIGLSILVVCMLFWTVTTYQKRWWISYKCFHLKLWIIGYEEFQDGREHLDFTYDVNIIFDEDDEEWVKNILKPGIQEHLPHLNRVLLGDRDLPLDMFYMDAVIYVIENSYKTVLVVSENAIRDHNFVTKLRQTVDHMNEEETEKALLVFKDDIRQGKLPYLVRLLMSKNKPYLLWHEDEYAQRLFWEKFTKNMLVNKKMNDLLPV